MKIGVEEISEEELTTVRRCISPSNHFASKIDQTRECPPDIEREAPKIARVTSAKLPLSKIQSRNRCWTPSQSSDSIPRYEFNESRHGHQR